MKARHRSSAASGRTRGITLIELMIAMLLGLVITGGAMSLMLANRQSYRTNEALSQVEESARTAFELLARDIRQAGVTGCDNSGRIANVLKASPSNWWEEWFGMKGYESTQTDPAVSIGTGTAERVAGTDSIQVQGLQGTGLTVETHDPVSANFKINAATTDFTDFDILVVCDIDHAAIFQVTNYSSSNVTVVHNTGNTTPGPDNCSKGLGYPTDCSTTAGNVYAFEPNSQVARFAAADWYVGNNGRPDDGGRSLWRKSIGKGASNLTEEMVAGVTNMQISYRTDGGNSFVNADDASITDWTKVNALMIRLTVDSADKQVSTNTSVNSGRLQRSYSQLITLRNRVP